MAMKNSAEYVASIRSLQLEANILGEPQKDLPDHPIVQPSQRAVAATYDCAQAEETRDLLHGFLKAPKTPRQAHCRRLLHEGARERCAIGLLEG